MAFYLRDREACRLARELATLLGVHQKKQSTLPLKSAGSD
jgi:hypothetical protein